MSCSWSAAAPTISAPGRLFRRRGHLHYTHVSDQLSTYGTKVVVATQPEVTYVLDETLGNQTDLPIAEHATDTAGASLVNFALFDLVGRQFSPRIRDLARSPCTALAPRPKRPPGSDATLECTR